MRCALTIGVFDGVHLGHAAIVRRCASLARDAGVAAVALTFDRQPEAVVAPVAGLKQLVSLERREELLAEAGADEVVVLEFDRRLAATAAEVFARELLASPAFVGVVVGENFRFGAKGAGNADLLAQIGAREKVPVIKEPLLFMDGRPVSSTRVREALFEGDVAEAARLLGRPAELEGIVVSGRGRGRELGYPTANLSVAHELLVPADGVYAARAFWEGRAAAAAVSIGDIPTFGGTARAVEAHLLDVSEELLGQQLRLEFVARLRDQERFDGPDALVAAIGRDVAATRRLVELAACGGG